MNHLVINIAKYIREDWNSHPVRCFLEIIAWVLSVACSVIMMLTVPDPPLTLLYPMWISQCIIFSWAAWTRRSSGLLANYILLAAIDTIALGKLLLL